MQIPKESRRRILLLSCSSAKRRALGVLPAIERYDGPAYRMLRRYQRGGPVSPPCVLILSAEFGLIEAEEPIPWYDRRMTADRAIELAPTIDAALDKALPSDWHQLVAEDRVFSNLGATYALALERASHPVAALFRARRASGGLGKKLSQLRDWLYGYLPDETDVLDDEPTPVELHRDVSIQWRGEHYRMSRAEALASIRLLLNRQPVSDDRVHVWYVLIDGRRVSPKRVVNILTGRDVGQFSTSDAMRFVRQIGFKVLKQ